MPTEYGLVWKRGQRLLGRHRGREVEMRVEVKVEREIEVWLKSVASEKRQINFLSQPMKSGIMLNFVFAKRPVICATMQIMKQRDWHQIGDQSLDFMRVLIVYAHRALSC